MRIAIQAGVFLLAVLTPGGPALGADTDKPALDFTTTLMRSTVKIEGPKTATETAYGTGFIVGKQSTKNPNFSFYVLVTAAHVLDGITADTATVHFREPAGSGFKRLTSSLPIRKAGAPLWTKHKDVDIAAMLIIVPNAADLTIIGSVLLATDAMLQKYEIRPGDQLLVLGYPHSLDANDAGFPILRSGRIASYPLTPTKDTKTFLLDFNVFPGNSGGPVFLYQENRFYGGSMHLGLSHFVLGLVTERFEKTERDKAGNVLRTETLQLGVVIHANFIEELVRSLPEPTDP
jgi:S1-C subfamily serine protease